MTIKERMRHDCRSEDPLNDLLSCRDEFEKFYQNEIAGRLRRKFRSGNYAEKDTRAAWEVWKGCWKLLNG